MKNKIVWKLAACFAAVLLVFAIVLGGVYAAVFRRHTISVNRKAMESQAVSIAETLASFEGGESFGAGRGGRGGYGAYLRFLNVLTTSEVWIVDSDHILVAPGRAQSPRNSLPPSADEILEKVLSGQKTYGEEFSSLLDAPALTVGVPICTEKGISGAVLLHSPVSGIDEAVGRALSVLYIGAAAALVLAGGTALLLAWRFTAPLEQMKATALRLAEGDYTAKTSLHQSDEIGQLARTIDLLAEKLELAEKQRSAVDQLKQDFLANISHELRTPVAVLRGSLEVLLDGTVSEPGEVADYYRQMLAEGRHLERLVNDLLDLTRLQDAQFRLEMEEVNLCDVVRDAARSIRQPARKKNITISLNCPDEECCLSGDYGRIRQMLLIMLDNAVKFSNLGDTVDLTLKKGPGEFILQVTDWGQGIPSEELPHIFDRFWTAHHGGDRSGTGLGLAIAQQIARRHNAEIKAASGQGMTCFSVYFHLT